MTLSNDTRHYSLVYFTINKEIATLIFIVFYSTYSRKVFTNFLPFNLSTRQIYIYLLDKIKNNSNLLDKIRY